MFELRYNVEYSDEEYEYYDIYKNGKPYYKNKEFNIILSFEIDRCSETIQFVNVTDNIIDEILFDLNELCQTILIIYDELDIKGYEVSSDDSLSNELDCVLECNNLK
jgi:hypothetical protein